MDFIDNIDAYILGKLSANELASFKNQLSVDKDLAMQVKQREVILLGLNALGNEKMKQRIKDVRREMLEEQKTSDSTKSTPSKYRTLRWLAVAASIIGVIFITKQIFVPNTIDNNQLVTEYFEPYTANFTTRDIYNEKDFLQAGKYYAAKEYNATIPLLKNILSQQPSNSDIELALANSLQSTDKIDDAIRHYQNIINRKDPLYADQARWYLALSYIKQNKIAESKTILQQLVDDPRADHHKEAKTLLSKL